MPGNISPIPNYNLIGYHNPPGRRQSGMKTWQWLTGIVVTFVVCAFLIIILGSIAPGNFPSGSIVNIEENSTLSHIADNLYKEKIIRSPFMYKAYAVLLGGDRNIKVGNYLFDQPQSSLRVAYRTIMGIQGLDKTRIVIWEGSTVNGMAQILERNIPGFDGQKFIKLAEAHEGFLFPDTYFFYPNVSPEEVLQTLRSNFERKMLTIKKGFGSLNANFEDIIIMASIVEREANRTEDRKIIAGILWKRLRDGMPLQVDAPFYYLLGKASSELTLNDLREDSPYNTYTRKGLPVAPISNPGLGAILDTINPTETKYWSYLSDSNGNTHYAPTLEQHVENRNKYL